MDIVGIELQGLDSILSQIAQDSNVVVWVRSPDYSNQIYLSPGFENIWGRPVSILYNEPDKWGDFLAEDKAEKIVQLIKSRKPGEEERSNNKLEMVYRIHVNNQIKYIKDSTFYLFDASGLNIGVGGMAQAIPEQQWMKEKEAQVSLLESKLDIKQKLYEAITKEFGLTVTSELPKPNALMPLKNYFISFNDGRNIKLTKREADCLFCLLKGYSAKEIARQLGISYRTVEEYLSNIRSKSNFRTNIALVTQMKRFYVK